MEEPSAKYTRFNENGTLTDSNSTFTNMIKMTLAFNDYSDKQQSIGINHMAFVDKKLFDKPKLLSLQQLNEILAFDDSCKDISKDDLQKRFNLLGVVLADDQTRRHTTNPKIIRNVYTIGIRGKYTVWDYWSSADRKLSLNRYDNCYFVVKKVYLRKDFTYRSDINASHVQNKILESRIRWQVLPYNTRDRVLTSKDLKINDKDKTHTCDGSENMNEVGFYWNVGHVHEYADFESRSHNYPTLSSTELVMTDVHHIMNVNNGQPIEFYFDVNQ